MTVARRVRTRARLRSIMLITAMLFGVIGLTSGAPPASAAYPGRDGRIAFTRGNQIYSITAAGTGVTKLTSAGKNYWPRWSPDGKRIAYIHETTTGSKDIWVMAANGANKKQVTHLGVVYGPAWSPDGAWIGFSGGAPGETAVLRRVRSVAPFDGMETLLAAVDDPSAQLEQQPITTTIAWSVANEIWYYTPSYPSSPDHYIVVYNVASKYAYAWVASGGACCGPGMVHQPVVSADGTKVGYTYTNLSPKIQIRTYPAYGTVTFTTKAQDEQLAFSPSGTKVAFMNDASGTARVFTANANGSGRKAITTGYQPDWQPLP